MDEKPRRSATGIAALLAGVLSVVGFYDVSRQYQQYRIDYAGIVSILDAELSFFVWYFTFGILAAAFLTVFFTSFWSGERLEREFKRIGSWRFFIVLCLVILAVETLAFQRWILQYAQIADDEATYAFIAQTLLKGRVVNPPPGDNEFFLNQFVILTRNAWYGKYPIGHPAMLALGEALGLRYLVVPALSCGVLFLTHRVGRRLFPGREAALAVLLLLISPHFVFMGATRMSHTTESLCLMGGLLALLILHEKDRLTWSTVAGICLGFGVLVRPFPGALFLPVAAAWVGIGLNHLPWRRRMQHLLAGGVTVAVGGGLLLGVNSLQTGETLRSGYQVLHGGLGFFSHRGAVMSVSLAGGILRENFWLFGWPLSLIFIPFARAGSRMALVWGFIGAVLAYRIIVPKTVVATLGPVYLTEMVPLLALATASGIRVARDLAAKVTPRGGTRVVSGFLLASTLVALTCFLPFELINIHRSSEARQRVFRLIEAKTSGKILVFANFLVDPGKAETWAYYPPNPSPDLDDKVIFAKTSPFPDRNVAFWKKRFPDRTAWWFQPERPAGFDFSQIQTARDFRGLR